MISGYDLNGLIWSNLIQTRIRIIKRISTLYMKMYLVSKGIKFGINIGFTGNSYFNRHPYSQIIIGNNCRFNSARKAISETVLYKPCAISTMRKGAKINIGDFVGATSVNILCFKEINIGNNVFIGANCVIMDTDIHHSDPQKRDLSDSLSRPVRIEDNVFLGLNSIVLKGVTIGENAVIAANSVVISSIPANSIAVGNPCKVLFKRK